MLCIFISSRKNILKRGKYNYLRFRWKPEEQEAGLRSEQTQEFPSGGLTENMEVICGMKMAAGGVCFHEKAMENVGTGCWIFALWSDLCPAQMLLAQLIFATHPHRWSDTDTDEIRSGAPNACLVKPCCAEPLVQLCQCL